MKYKTILKIYEKVNKNVPLNVGSSHRAFKQDSDFLKERYGLDCKVFHQQKKIVVPGYIMYYIGGVNEAPHKIRGFRTDTVEIYEDHLDKNIMNEVIAPMKHRAEIYIIDTESGGWLPI